MQHLMLLPCDRIEAAVVVLPENNCLEKNGYVEQMVHFLLAIETISPLLVDHHNLEEHSHIGNN